MSDSGGTPEAVISLNDIIYDIMMYWMPNAGPSSACLYWESFQAMRQAGMPQSKMPTPTGISMFAGEQVRLSQRWAEARLDRITHFGEHASGGHFAAMEKPGQLVADIRASFRPLR